MWTLTPARHGTLAAAVRGARKAHVAALVRVGKPFYLAVADGGWDTYDLDPPTHAAGPGTATLKQVRWARKDYNTPHRCPATSCLGNSPYRWERNLPDCPDGSYTAWLYNQPGWQWRTHRCPRCGVRTVPYVTRLIDPQWHLSNLRLKARFVAAEARTGVRDPINTLRN